MPVFLTILIVLAGIILGSILAVALSWVWLMFTIWALMIQAVRMRLAAMQQRFTLRNPITTQGIYQVLSSLSQPAKGERFRYRLEE